MLPHSLLLQCIKVAILHAVKCDAGGDNIINMQYCDATIFPGYAYGYNEFNTK